MLRVSEVWERALKPPSLAGLADPGDVVVIRSGETYVGKQGVSLANGVTNRSAGAHALCLHLVTIPPGFRGIPHFHAGHESAIYTVSGETEVWHGEGLSQRTIVHAGDFMYIPPGTPHLPVNRSAVMTIAVVARTDPQEQESVVTLNLPPHLAELSAFPVAGH
ncbi:MAG TPA: cupin domain-containing protein [Streptosporangiaceae bacterium]